MNRIVLLALIIFVCHAPCLHAQQPDWARAIGDTTGNTEVLFTSRYGQSDVLIGGRYNGKDLTLGAFTLKNKGQWDAFAALMNQRGEVLWAVGFGGGGEDALTAVASDAGGNMYIAVAFNSLSLTIGGFTLQNRGETDAALVRITSNRDVALVRHISNAGHDEISGIAVDPSGNILMSAQIINPNGVGDMSIFVAKLDAQNNVLWQKNSSGPEVRLACIALDDDGNCYAAGSLWGALFVEGGKDLDAGEERKGFILQYSSAGDWIRSLTDTTFSRINSMAAHGDHLYAAGERIIYYMGWGWPLADSKILLTKFDRNLRPVWERNCGGKTDLQSLDVVKRIGIDEEGSAYLTGYFFSGRLDFAGDTLGNPWNVNYYYQQVFVLKYDSSGGEIWSRGIGSKLNDVGYDIAVIGKDRFYLAGGFESDEIRIGDYTLTNTGITREIYVHLRPPRIGRNVRSFVAFYKNTTASVQPPRPMSAAIVYPNPVSNELHISLPESVGRSAELRLYTLGGRLLRYETVRLLGKEHVMDATGLRTGWYVLHITSGDNIMVSSVVKN